MAHKGYIREQLGAAHDVSRFNCGQAELDTWLRQHALKSSARDYSRTYVWHRGDSQVLALFTLSGYMISKSQLPQRQRKGEQSEIPSILLGKLALDITLQRLHLGEVLIADAIIEAEKASLQVAARYLVVDALEPTLIGFYEKFGFVKAPDLVRGKTRLFARMKDLKGR